MTRKITTILLALALCLTLLPVGAGAASTPSTYTLTNNESNQLLCDEATLSESSGTQVIYQYGIDNERTPLHIQNLSGYVLDGGSTGATYTLDDDVTIGAPLIIQGGTAANPVTLDLKGHVLKYENATKKNSVIVVADNAYFVMQDTSNASHTLYYTVDANGKWTFGTGTDYPNTIDLTGGIITGGTGSDCGYDNSETGRRIEQYYGGGVLVGSGATFTMTGGNIVGCSASSANPAQMNAGGGVYVAPGPEIGCNTVFHMTGGSIVGCSAQNGTYSALGGGVYVSRVGGNDRKATQGEVVIAGGSIIGCSVFSDGDKFESAAGGGIYVTGSLTMTAGTISGCTAKKGSGVYGAGSFFTMDA